MGWREIVKSDDLMILEKNLRDGKLKIEARKNGKAWEIFKTRVKGDSSYLLSEYVLDNPDKIKEIVELLKKGELNIDLSLHLKRVYKEEFIEKWTFKIGSDVIRNIVFLKFDNKIETDIIMHKKYKPYEKKILNDLEEKLGVNELGDHIRHNIYYFNEQSSTSKQFEAIPEYTLEFGFFD